MNRGVITFNGPDSLKQRLWWIVALITALVVACTTGLVLVGKLARRDATSGWTSSHPISRVRINSAGGTVEVHGGSTGGKVTVAQDIGWVTAKPKVDYSWDKDTLVLSVSCGGGPFLGSLNCQTDVRLQVPAGTAVDAESDSGAVMVDGVSGAVSLRSHSGPLNLHAVSGPLWLRSDSGPIEGDGLRSATVTARSASGPLSLNFAVAPQSVSAGSSSGPVDVLLPKHTRYQATATSRSGPASVDDGLDDPGSSATVRATSNSGPVDISYGS
ncbi:DUF4097 family beta strand repeat-containing protein [Streptacidiphilus carbonis]|uniref:DUF4097 family beta strand repeat-containing protein n=1 Tax=Streptacidiphilus carbonis TaxID=105422 RepID=UPI0009FC9055|nr:DUF4097 family beta strand repeat-containing protein [Streptacidiphilus carbonis]